MSDFMIKLEDVDTFACTVGDYHHGASRFHVPRTVRASRALVAGAAHACSRYIVPTRRCRRGKRVLNKVAPSLLALYLNLRRHPQVILTFSPLTQHFGIISAWCVQ